MKGKWRRLMAMLLVITMVLGICPDVVHAQEPEVTTEMAAEPEKEEKAADVSGGEKTDTATEKAAEKVVETVTETATETDAKEETEITTEAAEEKVVTEEKASTEEATASTEQTKKQENDTEQEKKEAAAPEQEATEEEQPVFQPVEKYPLYCLEMTRVYEKPDTASAVVKEFKEKDDFTVTAKADGWFQVEYTDKEAVKTGYVEDKVGCFTTRQPEEDEEETLMSLLDAGDSRMIYSDGSWDGGTIWYVKDGEKKHYVFCMNKGATMYSGKYTGQIMDYSGPDAFRISTALNYFKAKNGGWNGKSDYALVQQVIWNEGNSGLKTYIEHAWKLADNNGGRGPSSGSYDSKLKAVSGVSSAGGRKKIAESLTPRELKSNNGVIEDTISLSGSAWKYFAENGNISVMGIYDKEGKAVSYNAEENYVGSGGKLHVKITENSQTGFGLYDNPATIIMKVNFPYQGANKFRYLSTGGGKQNLTYEASGDTSAYFAIKIYAEPYEIKTELKINKVDEFGNFVSGCTFHLEAVSGEALELNGVKLPRDEVIDSAEDGFEIEKAGEYRLWESGVPEGGEYQINPQVVTFKAEWKQVTEDGSRPTPDTPKSLVLSGDNLANGLIDNGSYFSQDGNNLVYTCMNESKEGSARIVKYGKELVAYQDGKFIYEKKRLGYALFDIYAAEDIYVNDVLVIANGTKVQMGFEWGKKSAIGSNYTHTVTMSGNATDDDGCMTIYGLPYGNYYAVETSAPSGYELSDKRYPFTINSDQTVDVNAEEGILNEQATAVCHVYKVNEDTQKPLNGGEFTLYANINNTNFQGQPLFTTADTVPAVTARDLSTGEETVEEGTWIPIQTVTTASGGMAEFDDLPRGTYLVTETKAPVNEEGRSYELAEKSYVFEHNGQTNASSNGFNFEHTFKDVLAKEYEIVKYAEVPSLSDSGIKDVYIYDEEPVAGAVFGLYAEEDIRNTVEKEVWAAGQQIATVTSNEQGIAAYTGVLFAGRYYFKELKTPDDTRYILDPEEYHFVVEAEGSGGPVTENPVVNKQYKGSIRVVKTDGETKYPIEGVEFSLQNEEKQAIGTFTTDASGEIHIENLPVATYYLQETKTLSNYYLDEKTYEVTISAEELNQTVEITNDRMKGSIKVIKTDGETKYPLEGVEFTLSDAGKKAMGTYKTDQNGEIRIKELEIGMYYLQETKTLSNYYLNDKTYEVTITPENLNQTLEITNERMKGSIKVIKTDGETKYPLEGVEFTLSDAGKKTIGTYKTDKNGEIHVEGLEIGTYYLQETKTLSNYYLNDKTYEVTITPENLNQTLEITNERMKGSIKVIKTDGHTSKPMKDVEFDLLDAEKKVISSYKTDKNGEILVEGLEVGIYYLQETKTLKGYKLSDELVEVELTPESLDKTVEITNNRNDTSITARTHTTITGHGGVKTGDSSMIGFILGLFFLSVFAAIWMLTYSQNMAVAVCDKNICDCRWMKYTDVQSGFRCAKRFHTGNEIDKEGYDES